MKSKTKRKINSKIKKFFKSEKKIFSASPKILLKLDFDGKNKFKTIFFNTILQPGNYVKKVFFLELGSRKLKQALVKWKLQRLRAKILKAEKKELYTFYRPSESVTIFSRRSLDKVIRGRSLLKKMTAFAVILLVIAATYVQNSKYSQGATYTFAQTSWSGGATANTAVHPTNQESWNQYSSKDSGISAVNGGADLQLTPSSSAANIDFNTEANYTQENAANGTDFENGVVKITMGGSVWTQRTLPASINWTSVTYGNGIFVAVARSSNIAATSPDGITWTQRTLPVTGWYPSITYANGIFVTVILGTNQALTSPDGITWTQRTLPATANWASVAYGNGIFVAVSNSSNTAATSPDGITWTQRTLATSANWQNSMTYGSDKFVLVGYGTNIANTSPDGITWTARTLPATANWYGVTYGNGLYVAVASGGTAAATSPDGITWTARTLPVSTAWISVAYSNGIFVAVANSSSIAATSPDGITWTQRTLPASAGWYSVAYGNGMFATVAYGSSIAATSPIGNPTSQPYYITTTAASQINTSAWGHISSVALTQTTPTNTSLKYLVSFDNRSTWKYWNGSAWTSSSLDNLQTNGMEKTALEAITQAQWEASGGFIPGTGTLDFAADLATTNELATPELDNIAVNYQYYPVLAGTSNVDYATEGNYTQEDAANGTDFGSGKVTLTGVPPDSYTKLLLHTDGVNGSTTFTDSSLSPKTVTANGDAQISTAQKQFGSGGLSLDGAGDYLAVDDSTDWEFGSGNFTIDFWFKDNGTAQYGGLISRTGTGVYQEFIITKGATADPIFKFYGSTMGTSWNIALDIGTPSSSQFDHYAIVRNGNVYTSYKNGTLVATVTQAGALMSGTGYSFHVGKYGTYYGKGYLDEIRISKGIARWTSNFTPPSASYYPPYPTSQPYYITTTAASQINTSAWGHISSVALTQTTPTNTSLKYLVSFDNRSTWKYWNGSAWTSSSLDNLQTNGMEKTALEAITQAQWEASGGFIPGTGTLDFAADLATTNELATPELDNIAVNYTSLPYSLISSKYDSGTSSNTMSKIQWTENLPTGTDAKFQVRTSADNSTWTEYLGPDGTSSTYFTDPTGGEGMPSIFTSGDNDRYFQYKAYLSATNSGFTPTISDVNVSYSVNAPPNFDSTYGTNGVNVSQVSNSADSNWGKVKIDYSIRDIDTTSGTFTKDYATPTFEYSLNGGGAWSSVNLANVTFSAPVGGDITDKNSDGKLDNKVLEGSYLTYTAYWDAKNQTGLDGTYSGNFQIRVTVDDNEGANRTATAIGNTTTLDVKNPVAGAHPILINASTSPATLTLSATDDSTLKMDVNLTNSFASILTTAYNSSPTIALATDPDTVYVKYQDIYGNTSSAYSTTTPETPTKMMVQDTTNMDTTPIEYRLFLAWKANVAGGFGSYKIYRSENQSDWDLKYTQTDPAINYYSDSSMASDTKYYYKVITTDTNGNISYNSSTVNGKANGTQDAGEGGGGAAPGDFPAISEVTAGTPASTSVTITWETDDPADSVVQYMTDTGGDFEGNNALSKGKATLLDSDANLGDHSVTLTNLAPATTYYYQVISTSAAGAATTEKDGVNGYSFTTASGPAISNVTVSSETNDSATVTWATTGTNSTSYVYYSTSPILASPAKLGNDTLTASHSISIGGLSADTTYYFKVESTDGNSATSTDDNDGNYYTFTANDSTGPVISGRAQPIKTYESAAIYWATDENSTSQVRYSAASGGPYTSTAETAVYDRGHYVVVSSLSADTDYYYKVYSKDIAGNETLSSEQTFATLKDPSQQHDPLEEITDVADPPAYLTDEKAVITFKTDQPANCTIEYGTTLSLGEVPVSEDDGEYNESHSIHLSGLVFSTLYYYQIVCEDNLDTVVTENNSGSYYSFTTLEQQYGGSEIPGGDTTAPEISNVSTGTITGESVTVKWDTDEDSSSSVKYGIKSGTYDNEAGNSDVNSDTANYVIAHDVILNNLVPGTKYYFIARSLDASGNIGESDESSFTTKSASNLSSIKFSSIKLGEVTVTWKSSEKTTSVVEYGETEAYTDSKESKTQTTDHSLNITGLKSNIEYHFRVSGQDADNNLYSSGDYTFTPKSPPTITNVKLTSSTEHEAVITFTTSAATDALITYANTADSDDTGSQGNPTLTTSHSLTLKNLTAGTTYSYSITAKDLDGNSTSYPSSSSGQVPTNPTFTTGKDTNPPKIDQVRTDSALAQNDKVQTIISWITDELSTTALIYKEGQNAEPKEVKISDNPTTSHIAVITIFKPGTVYYFKVKSADMSGNSAASSDFALLTPKRKENIVQIIVANFQDIFNWARFGS